LLVAALAALVVGGCSPEAAPSVAPDSHPATLARTTWTLVSIQGQAPAAGTAVTVEFGPDRLSGASGCNSYGGGYAYDPASGDLRIGDLGSTKRACAKPALNELEAAFLLALRGVSAASLDPDGRLVLRGSGPELVWLAGPQLDQPAGVP
jgi:heat shock protein HslJ